LSQPIVPNNLRQIYMQLLQSFSERSNALIQNQLWLLPYMCSHRPRLYHCTYFENIVIICYYIIHDILYRTRVHTAYYSVFSHICQCPRDIQTHYNALYYFFRCCSQQEFGQCLILQYRKIFSECRKRRRQIMMTIIKNLEQQKYIFVTVRGFLVSVSYLSQCTCTHEHHAERPYNNIFVIYDFFPFLSLAYVYVLNTRTSVRTGWTRLHTVWSEC